MTNWTPEERRELEEVRRKTAGPIPHPEAAGLRMWFAAWCNAVERYNAAYQAAPGGLEVPPVEEVLATFKTIGAQLVDLLARLEAGHRLAPAEFRRLLEEGEALEEKAATACESLPEHDARTIREAGAFAVCLMARGLPFQLRHYAQHAGGLLQ